MRRGREGAKEAAYVTTTASFAATPTTLSVTIAGATPLSPAGAADAAADVAAANVDPASSISGAAVCQPAAAVRRAAADAITAAVPSADAAASVSGAALLHDAPAHADAASVALPGPSAADPAKGGRPGAPPLAALARSPSRGGDGHHRVTAGGVAAAVARAGCGSCKGSPSRRHPTPPSTPRGTCTAQEMEREGVATEPVSGAMGGGFCPRTPGAEGLQPGEGDALRQGGRRTARKAILGKPAFLHSLATHCSDGNTKTCKASHRAVVSNPLPCEPNTNDLQTTPPRTPNPDSGRPATKQSVYRINNQERSHQ